MSKKLIQAAAGAAGGESVYVDDVFSTYLYEGTGAAQSITNGIDFAGEGGMLWIKDRDAVSNGYITDTERSLAYLRTNSTSAEVAHTATYDVTALNSDGFSVGLTNEGVNTNGNSNVSWSFRKQAGFFDVVTYTGNGTAGRTVSHNLGSTPAVMIIKNRTTNGRNWAIYHESLGNTKALDFTTGAAFTWTAWNSTSPTDSEFTVGADAEVNANGESFVAYLFAHDDQSFGDDSDESIIKCGSYTGTGSYTNPPVIDLGFEPQLVIIKNASSTGDWLIGDIMRGATSQIIGSTGEGKILKANLSNAETSYSGGYIPISPTATGFTMSIDGSEGNASGNTYIYIAIRRPMKTPEAGTDVFDLSNPNTTRQANAEISSNLSYVDMFWTRFTGLTDGFDFYNRLRGQVSLDPTSTAAEGTQNRIKFDKMNGVTSVVDWTGGTSYDFIDYFFKRATGFFDVVAYTGTSGADTVSHNLGVVPEMIWVKSRTEAVSIAARGNWVVYHKDVSSGYLNLHDTVALQTADAASKFGNGSNLVSPTDTNFTVADDYDTGRSANNYIAYLFATLAGVSKVGSFTGIGSGTLNVDCGFSAGCRFVLVKRTDGTGDWWVFDSARGITVGNDPRFALNSTAVETSTGDFLYNYSSGFVIEAGSTIVNGANYIFLAIA